MSDGRVLFAGGTGSAGVVNTVDIMGANGAITAGPSMLQARSNAGCALLPDGRVFVAGGNDGIDPLASSEYYTPSTGAWTSAGSMHTGRYGHTATVTPFGAVVLAGGQTSSGVSNQLEVFRPSNNRFTVLTQMSSARTNYAIVGIDSHRLLIAGGSDGQNTLSSIDIFDANTNQLTSGGAMLAARSSFGAALLIGGNVMFTGGMDANGKVLNSTEIYDPRTQASIAGPQLNVARANHQTFALPGNGSVLVFGGTDGQNALSASEVYQPWTGKFAAGAPMNNARTGAGNSLLHSGYLVTAGGRNGDGYLAGAETYLYASVATDKPDYSPGSVATFTGTGWRPGETVALSVTAFPATTPTTEFTGTAVADPSGAIHIANFNVDQSHLGMTFLLTAIGSQSQAETIFTDGDSTAVSLFGGGLTLPGGSSLYGTDLTIPFIVTDTTNNANNPPAGTATLVENNVTAGFVNIAAGSTSTFIGTGGSPDSAEGVFFVTHSDSSEILTPGFSTFQITFTPANNTWNTSLSASFTYQILAVNTSTTMTSPTQTIAYGQTATLQAEVVNVANAAPPEPAYTGFPTGNLFFTDLPSADSCTGIISPGAPAPPPPALLNGTSYYNCTTLPTLAPGVHTFQANYQGNFNLTNTSGSVNGVNIVVQTVNTFTTITPNIQSPQIYPSPINLSVTVAPVAGASSPAGTVEFFDNGTTPLCGGTAYVLTPQSNATSTATSCNFVLDVLPGNHSLSAQYLSSVAGNWNNSTSNAVAPYVINPAPTSTTLSTQSGVIDVGASVSLTATVTCTTAIPCSPSDVVPAMQPGGTVTFLDVANGGVQTSLGSQVLTPVGTGGSSSATLTLPSGLVGGTHSITAQYVPPVGPTPPADWQTNQAPSATQTYTITGIEPTFSVTTAPAIPSAFQGLTFTFTAIPAGGHTPTGNVSLILTPTAPPAAPPAYLSGLVALNSGTATFNIPSGLAAGTYTFAIDYFPLAGEVNFVGPVASSIVPVTVSIGKTTTAVTVTSSQTSPMLYGTQVTFTATVTPNGVPGTPGGTVQFFDNGGAIGAPVTTSNGVATLTSPTGTPLLAAAVGGLIHPITAVFTDTDNNFLNSPTSPAFNMTVNQATSATTVSANVNTINLGQSVTYTVSVQGTPAGAGNPAGTIAINDNGSAITAGAPPACTITLGATNPATGSCTVTYSGNGALTGGVHSIVAVFTSSTVNMAGSTSSPITETVSPSNVTIGPLTMSASSVVYNDAGIAPTINIPYSFGITGPPAPPAPSMAFQVYDGTNLIGTYPASPGTVPVAGSPATFTLPLSTYQTVGAHTFTVKYPTGDPNYAAASSTSVAFTVTKFAPTVTPSSFSGSPVLFGNPATVGGSVNIPNGAGVNAAAATGTLTFTFGTTTLGNCTLSGGTCTLGTTNSALTAGADTINIAYNGDANYSSGTGSGTLTVSAATATGSITTSPTTQAAFGAPVQITATFLQSGVGNVGTPTGTATIYDVAPGSGGTPVSIGTVPLLSGIGSLTTSSLIPGNHTLYASFNSGDANFASISQANGPHVALTINNGNTSITLTPSANPTSLNQTITYNFTVTGGPSSPVGTVTLFDAITNPSTALSCNGVGIAVTLTAGSGNSSSGACNITYNSGSNVTGAGSHPITATYTPSGPNSTNWSTATSPLVTEVVGQIAPTISQPVATPAPANYGVNETYSIVLTPANPSPAYGANTVQFYDAGVPLGGPVSASNPATGTFSYGPTVPTAGSHTITAQFIGDSNYAASLLSPKLVFTIGKATPTVSIAAPIPSSAPYYSMIGTVANPLGAITVAVPAGNNGVTPTGSVSLIAGTTTLATGNLASNGTITFQNIQLPASLTVNNSPYNLYVQYGGDGNWAATPSTTTSLVITPAPAPVVVTASSNNPVFGQSVTLTATFNGPGNPVAGTLTFLNGTTVITNCVAVPVANNVATCTTSLLPVGADNITVSNLALDPNHSLGAVTTTTVTVGSATTATVLVSGTNPSQPGVAVTFTATVTVLAPGNGTNTLNGTVTFTWGLATPTTNPLAACANLALNSHSSPAQVTCSVPANTAPFTAAGQYLITATYNPAIGETNTTSSATITQNVGKAPPTFTSISSSVNPSVFGQTVTLTATFTVPGNTPPTGTVQFYDGANTLGGAQTVLGSGPYTATVTVPSGGIATFSVGNHSISAVYSPGVADSYGSGNSATQNPAVILVQTVTQAGSNATPAVNPTSETYATVGIPNAPVYGEQITFVATIVPVAPATGTPTGFAYLADAGTQIGPTMQITPGNGSSTFSITTSSINAAGPVPNLGIGPHPNLVVHYLGDTNFLPAVSGVFPSVTISAAPTITALTPISAVPQKFGTEFTLNARVCAEQVNAGPSALNTCESTPYPGFKGTMMFYDGGTLLNPGGVGAAVDPSAGTASITITLSSPPLQAAAPGTHSITATYSGDVDFATSTSPPASLQVGQGPTTTTITSNVNPSLYGQPVIFTATVIAPGSFGPLPTGSATFVDNGLVLGVVALVPVSGIATAQFTVPNALNLPLTVGNTASSSPHNISVQYSGDVNYAASTTAPPPCTANVSQGCALVQNVNQAATTTTIASSQNGSVTGQQVILTATVTVIPPGAPVLNGASAGPTGTVTFWSGYVAGNNPPGTQLGTGILTRTATGNSSLYTATVTLNSLPTALTAITAVYSGDPNYGSSTSAALNQSVSKVQSQANLNSNLNPSILGQPVTYTVTITAINPTPNTPIPTGSVYFFDGSNILANPALVGGQATFTTALPVGGHLLSVNYPGDLNFQPTSSTAINEIVNKIQSTLNLTSSIASGAVASQVITFLAQIQPNPPVGVAYPTGQVAFFMDGATPPIGVANLASGVATLSTTLPAGNHEIQASYIGDNNWTSAQSTYLAQIVGTATTTTQIVSSANPSVFGQAVTLTITVAVPYPGTVPANGTVQLYDGGNAIGNPLPANNGTFSTTLSNLAVGTHSIIAQFQANGSFGQSSSAALSQIVNKAPTVTTLAAFPNSSTSNESVTLTAVLSVTSPGSTAAAAPSGTVQFVNTSTSVILGTAPLNLVGGVWTATLNVSSLTQGSQSQLITATYSGDGNFATSTSLPAPLSVYSTQITVVNAAGYTSGNLAPNSFATIYGSNLAYTTTSALVTPLPTSLAGTTVTVTDSTGTARLAPLLYVSLPQINMIIPANTAYGLATVTVTNASGENLSTWILITVSAPGLFSENMNGSGVAAGYLLTQHADGTVSTQVPLFQYNPNTSQYVPIPIVWNNSTDQQYLVLYGTGWRGAPQSAVTATINGMPLGVIYAGAQPQFTGEDQVNLGPIPMSLKGAGVVNIVIIVNGEASNTVTVDIQ